MKKEEIIQKSVEMITEYYKDNLEPFFSSVSDDVLWIGPRSGQILQGRSQLMQAWETEDHNLLFSMGNITVKSLSTGRNNLEVLLEYYVDTLFPDGETSRHHQRLHYSWGYRRVEEDGKPKRMIPRVCMIHISNLAPDSVKNGQIYASSVSDSEQDAVTAAFTRNMFSRMIYGKGLDEVAFYINSASVLWLESTDKGRHSIIHSLEGNSKAVERLRYFEEHFSDVLLRAHSSYLINPLYVRSVKRFEVILTDGTTLPIPEKKYTAFRRKLENWKWEPDR